MNKVNQAKLTCVSWQKKGIQALLSDVAVVLTLCVYCRDCSTVQWSRRGIPRRQLLNNRVQKKYLIWRGGTSGGELAPCQARAKSWETTDKVMTQSNGSLCLCLLYSKRNRQGYTVNEMIHNMEEVNIRERTGMVNKCRHQKGFWTLSKLVFLSTGDSTQYSTSLESIRQRLRHSHKILKNKTNLAGISSIQATWKQAHRVLQTVA